MAHEFVSHLEELRKRLIISLCAFSLAAAVSYFFSGTLIDLLIAPLRSHRNAQLIFQTPYEAFLIHIKVAALCGLVISLPILFIQFWLFVAPGLYQKEKKTVLPLALSSVVLFLFGAAFAYFLIVPVGLDFLLSFETESMRPLLAIAPYFEFLFGMILAFGIMFDFPVILLGLAKMGIVNSRGLAKARKFIVLAIFVLAAVLTPSPDPVSQLLLAIPLLALFEVSVIICRWVEKKGG